MGAGYNMMNDLTVIQATQVSIHITAGSRLFSQTLTIFILI